MSVEKAFKNIDDQMFVKDPIVKQVHKWAGGIVNEHYVYVHLSLSYRRDGNSDGELFVTIRRTEHGDIIGSDLQMFKSAKEAEEHYRQLLLKYSLIEEEETNREAE